MSNARRLLLSRKNLGRRMAAEFLDSVSTAIGDCLIPEHLTSLKEHDQYADILAHGGHPCLSCGSHDEAATRLAMLAVRHGNESAALMLPESHYCGAVRLPLKQILSNWQRLMELGEGELSVVSINSKNGFRLFDEDATSTLGHRGFSLYGWGVEWNDALGPPGPAGSLP